MLVNNQSEYLYVSISNGILIILLIAVIFALIKEKKNKSSMQIRFAGVLDADAELAKINERIIQLQYQEKELSAKYKLIEDKYDHVTDAEAIVLSLENKANDTALRIEELQAQYKEKRSVFDILLAELAIYDEKIAFAEMGMYEPHFDFSDSDEYKSQIEIARDAQKRLITQDSAVVCNIQWSVDGSKSKGRVMTNRLIKLTLRAFNNECDAAISNARWNNVKAMDKRITKAMDQINRLNESNHVYISESYLEMKRKELYLTHEYREKLKLEREERAEAARTAREEQKLLRDMELAETTEAHYQKLLAQAKIEAGKASGAKLSILSEKVKMLEEELSEAHAKVERAQALAERTRCGYIYVISNIGSFGQNVVKIGLTRRLDPMDRIRELGDASVPFSFDTHAIIYSEDAPALERSLHSEFAAARINTENNRKEFFRASIEQVEEAVKRLAPLAAFFKDVEAQEFRETMARRQFILNTETVMKKDLPLSI